MSQIFEQSGWYKLSTSSAVFTNDKNKMNHLSVCLCSRPSLSSATFIQLFPSMIHRSSFSLPSVSHPQGKKKYLWRLTDRFIRITVRWAGITASLARSLSADDRPGRVNSLASVSSQLSWRCKAGLGSSGVVPESNDILRKPKRGMTQTKKDHSALAFTLPPPTPPPHPPPKYKRTKRPAQEQYENTTNILATTHKYSETESESN